MLSFFRKRKSKAKNNRHPQIKYKSTAIALTDVGEIRKINEDSIVFVQPHNKSVLSEKGCLAIVCDGMGGHKSGEVASQIAVDKVSKYYYSSKTDIKESIKEAIIQAHKDIRKIALRNSKHSNMGTTCTAAIIRDQSIYIGHAGDSRAYLINENKIKQLTKDHTYVQHLYDKGLISEEEMLRHPDRNIVTMVLGTQSEFKPEVHSYENVFCNDETLMICSDGLYEYIKDNEIKNILTKNEIATAAEMLVDTAKKRGGHDNISVIIVTNKRRDENEKIQTTKEIN